MGRRYCLMLLALLTVASQPPRYAAGALGEPASSVASDQKALSAARGARSVLKAYTVEEIRSDSATVREYVAPSGIVFAVAWDGLVTPDLSQLLGSYAGEYRQALRQSHRQQGRRAQRVATNRVVVEKWGHMRNLQGRAYAPALMPPGVSVDEIK